jgi:tetratricopeptide (TPR) repeat protein
MTDIFISYAREDAVRADRLAAALVAAGYSVWWDKNLTAGERYSEETEGYLHRARAVLVLWSDASIASGWVRDEAGVGRDAGKLVPVTFDGVEPPIGFRQVQALAVDDRSGEFPKDAFRQLSNALAKKLSPDGAPPTAAHFSPQPVKASSARRLPVLGGLIAAAALAVIALAFVNTRKPADEKEMAEGARLAVPPISVEGADAELAGLAMGLTHGMRAMLRERGFDVRGYQYPEKPEDMAGFIKKLGVEFVVRGAVVEIGDALLYNVDIVDAKSERAVASFQMQEPNRADLAVVKKVLDRVAETLAPDGKEASPAPSNADFYTALGLVEDAASKADFVAARERLERAIAREPGNAAAHALYAYALASIDRYAADSAENEGAAAAAIDRAFSIGGADAEAHFARAMHHYVYSDEFSRLDRVEAELKKATEIDPGNMRALKWLISVRILKGDYAEAIRIADHVLALSPDYRDVQGNRISAQFALGERDASRRALDELLVETPEWAWGRRFRASVAISDGDFEGARREIERAEAIDAVAWNAEILTVVEANAGAPAAAQAAIDLHAERSDLDPAWVAYKKDIIGGDIEGAHRALQSLVAREERPRQRAQALLASGFMHLYKGEPAPARAACAESVALSRQGLDAKGPPELSEVCAAIAAARLGETAEAKALIGRFEATRVGNGLYRPYWTQSLLAALEAETGDKRAALDIIGAMIESGWRTPKTALCRHCVHLSVADRRGLFAKIADEPRFKAMMAPLEPEAAR